MSILKLKLSYSTRYFFLMCILGLSSCNNKVNKNYLLVGKQIKYWDIVDSLSLGKSCYSFSKEGKCGYYYYEDESCTRSEFYDGDMIYEDTWDLVNDSTIRFRSVDRRILILNEDTLLTSFKGVEVMLLKSRCQDSSK